MDRNYEQEYKKAFEAAKGLHEAGNALTKKQMEIVFPQLVESEDEIHRKWILEYLYDGLRKADEQFKDHFKSAIDWLEKQKERGPLTKEEEYTLNRIIEYLEDETCPSEWISLLHDIYCLPYGKQKEQKPIPANSVGLKEQKPWKVGANAYFTPEQKPATWSGDDGMKPAEWSEEDERMIRCITNRIESDIQYGNELTKAYGNQEISWLKALSLSLKKRNEAAEKLCSNEWSEEDEEVMEDLYNFVISDFIQDHIHETRWKPWKTTLERNRQNRLKSLRPVSKESLQSWKPSEEQMKALLGAEGISRASGYSDNAKVLASLYEELKRLRG